MRTIFAATVLATLLIVQPALAQWEQVADTSVPRNDSGEPDLTAPAPRTADGKPNLAGVWVADADLHMEGVAFVEGEVTLPRHLMDVMIDLEPGEVEKQPWAAELVQQRLDSRGLIDPVAFCKPWGITQHAVNLMPFKIVQTADLVVILYEQDTVFRQIFLDGRAPVEDPVPRWFGYSTGRWDDDDLVVETTGFTDLTWLDFAGNPHTEALRLTERIRRTDAGHLQIATTVDDPEVYSKPFTYTFTATVFPDDDLLEFFCTDNEISSQHYQ